MRVTGLEPARRGTPEPKSGASANSATPANHCWNFIMLSFHPMHVNVIFIISLNDFLMPDFPIPSGVNFISLFRFNNIHNHLPVNPHKEEYR